MIGEKFVFVGEDIEDEHLSNFEYGTHYTVKSISALPDGDLYQYHQAILFENFKYGVLKVYFDKYFISVNDFRNNKISNFVE